MEQLNLLFDLDGTLTDSGAGIVHSVRHTLQRCGVPVPPEPALRWCVGPPLQELFERLLGPARASQVPEAIALYRGHYRAVGRFENRVYTGIPEALEVLAGHVKMYVVTVKPRDLASQILAHFGLRHRFRGVYGGQPEGGQTDPGINDEHKESIIAGLLEREGIAPDRSVMIGDRGADMAGACRHGLRAIGVAWGFGSDAELRAGGAQAILHSPAELVARFGPGRRADSQGWGDPSQGGPFA